ncbi:MAG: CBS domain-containing protein [Planctomycetota bacterium]
MTQNNYPAAVVGHWMSTSLYTIAPGKKVEEAIEIMGENRIRHLPVVDSKGKLVGLVSSHDVNRSGDLSAAVKSVMTPREKLVTIDSYEPVRGAAGTICEQKISGLPVMQGEKLVGIVTSEDLLWALLQEETHED